MDYDEACMHIVSADVAEREINKHGLQFEDFAAEYGNQSEYRGKDVLDWLGY